MFLHAESVKVETDEGRFTLEIESTTEDMIVVDIQSIDLDAFYDQVKARIGPYLREKHEARVFACDPDESAGLAERVVAIREDGSYRVEPDEDAYDLTDPKHPRFHSVHADLWDARAGK